MNEAGELRDVPLSWPVSSTRDIHRDDWVVAVRKDTISRPGHPEEQFGRIVVEDPGAVVILAIDDMDRVVVVKQYRHPAQMRLVELPAGKLDQPGEDPLVAAKRELAEEAGLEADRWTHLMTTWASPGITAETHALYLATGLRASEQAYEAHHEEADMLLERVPREDLIEAVLDGRVADAPLITAILAHETLLARGRL